MEVDNGMQQPRTVVALAARGSPDDLSLLVDEREALLAIVVHLPVLVCRGVNGLHIECGPLFAIATGSKDGNKASLLIGDAHLSVRQSTVINELGGLCIDGGTEGNGA